MVIADFLSRNADRLRVEIAKLQPVGRTGLAGVRRNRTA